MEMARRGRLRAGRAAVWLMLGRRARRAARVGWCACGLLVGLASGGASFALPEGPQIRHGQVQMSKPDPRTLNIRNSPNAIIDWRSFSIASQETARFVQDSARSAVLNRVVGGDLSAIHGRLLSNGRVFLVNPNGVLVGPTGVIDTAGFVASTLNIANQDFIEGRYRFEGGPDGAIRNEGLIRASAGGEVVLIAPSIENSGIVDSGGGSLILAAGRKVHLRSIDNPDIEFEVQAPEDEVLNLGELLTKGGPAALLAGTIRSEGLISADTLERDASGKIVLKASRAVHLGEDSVTSASGGTRAPGGQITVMADADPSKAPEGSVPEGSVIMQQGAVRADGTDGGWVGLRADRIFSDGPVSADGEREGGTVRLLGRQRVLATASSKISARGKSGAGGDIEVNGGGNLFSSARHDATGKQGGEIRLLGHEVELAAASADASGRLGGGSVKVGGGLRGEEAHIPNASRTVVNSATTLAADATKDGDGGTVVVWGEDETQFTGRIAARGGPLGGDGGLVEVSGKQLAFEGQVDVTAPEGRAGLLLLDPTNINIIASSFAGVRELLDPRPNSNDNFGSNTILRLGNTRLVVLDPSDDFVATNTGAAYLFDVATGALLSDLMGASAGDQVGSGGITSLGTNYIVRSPNFRGGDGALTLADGLAGVSGVVSTGNSLVGAAGDGLGGASTSFTFLSRQLPGAQLGAPKRARVHYLCHAEPGPSDRRRLRHEQPRRRRRRRQHRQRRHHHRQLLDRRFSGPQPELRRRRGRDHLRQRRERRHGHGRHRQQPGRGGDERRARRLQHDHQLAERW